MSKGLSGQSVCKDAVNTNNIFRDKGEPQRSRLETSLEVKGEVRIVFADNPHSEMTGRRQK